MKKFTAGRFEAGCFLGVQNGRATAILEYHRNGSDEIMGRLQVDFEDLPDLLHVLTRAIAAHKEST